MWSRGPSGRRRPACCSTDIATSPRAGDAACAASRPRSRGCSVSFSKRWGIERKRRGTGDFMIEFVAEEERRLAIELEYDDASPAVIKVIGVGGGGCNSVNRMMAAGVKVVQYATCNTDLQALRRTSAPLKLQIGS